MTKLTKRFVRMFKPRFALLVESGAKKQTVRPTPKRMPRAGDAISLRAWQDKPYRSKQRVLHESTITRVDEIRAIQTLPANQVHGASSSRETQGLARETGAKDF